MNKNVGQGLLISLKKYVSNYFNEVKWKIEKQDCLNKVKWKYKEMKSFDIYLKAFAFTFSCYTLKYMDKLNIYRQNQRPFIR